MANNKNDKKMYEGAEKIKNVGSNNKNNNSGKRGDDSILGIILLAFGALMIIYNMFL